MPVTTKPTMISDRCANFRTSEPAASEDTRMPNVAALKMIPVSIASYWRTTCR